MANFLDATAELELRLREYADRLSTIEAHLRRGEKRAARARLEGFLEELVDFARDVELPLDSIVVGAQLGFFSGGTLLRGRLPGALVGALAGWMYGQQAMQQHRKALEQLAERVAMLTVMLETEAWEAGSTDDAPRVDARPAERQTLEITRNPDPE